MADENNLELKSSHPSQGVRSSDGAWRAKLIQNIQNGKGEIALDAGHWTEEQLGGRSIASAASSH